MTKLDRLSVEIPKRLRSRPRDHRGLPIPYIVLIDKNRRPQFTINDVTRVNACRSLHICGLCGKRFESGAMWFVGGPRCFTERYGAFVDPPMHLGCAEYALQVCPFLAAPSYAKRIDDKLLGPGAVPDGRVIANIHHDMPSAQPEIFGLGCTRAYQYVDGVFVPEHWDYVEWWKNGVTTDAPDRGMI